METPNSAAVRTASRRNDPYLLTPVQGTAPQHHHIVTTPVAAMATGHLHSGAPSPTTMDVGAHALHGAYTTTHQHASHHHQQDQQHAYHAPSEHHSHTPNTAPRHMTVVIGSGSTAKTVPFPSDLVSPGGHPRAVLAADRKLHSAAKSAQAAPRSGTRGASEMTPPRPLSVQGVDFDPRKELWPVGSSSTPPSRGSAGSAAVATVVTPSQSITHMPADWQNHFLPTPTKPPPQQPRRQPQHRRGAKAVTAAAAAAAAAPAAPARSLVDEENDDADDEPNEREDPLSGPNDPIKLLAARELMRKVPRLALRYPGDVLRPSETLPPSMSEARRKQIEKHGFGSAVYQRYLQEVPKCDRREGNVFHPVTPRPEYNWPRRQFKKLCSAWRRCLRVWGPLDMTARKALSDSPEPPLAAPSAAELSEELRVLDPHLDPETMQTPKSSRAGGAELVLESTLNEGQVTPVSQSLGIPQMFGSGGSKHPTPNLLRPTPLKLGTRPSPRASSPFTAEFSAAPIDGPLFPAPAAGRLSSPMPPLAGMESLPPPRGEDS